MLLHSTPASLCWLYSPETSVEHVAPLHASITLQVLHFQKPSTSSIILCGTPASLRWHYTSKNPPALSKLLCSVCPAWLVIVLPAIASNQCHSSSFLLPRASPPLISLSSNFSYQLLDWLVCNNSLGKFRAIPAGQHPACHSVRLNGLPSARYHLGVRRIKTRIALQCRSWPIPLIPSLPDSQAAAERTRGFVHIIPPLCHILRIWRALSRASKKIPLFFPSWLSCYPAGILFILKRSK